MIRNTSDVPLPQYLAWRKSRHEARAAHPCAMDGCRKTVSGNKIFCLAHWEQAKASVAAEAATRETAGESKAA
jgi:hypothetical protein